jgi:hypothetical protein
MSGTPPPARDEWMHDILMKIHKDLGRTEGKVDNLTGDFQNMQREYRKDIAILRREHQSELKDTNTKVESLQGFKNRLLGLASGISVVVGFGMSLLVNWITRKF